MTWIVMVPIFYGVFLPFGLLFRRGRRDRMKRYYDPDAQSYWEERPERPAGYRERPY